MKAITIHQSWAWAIAAGYKDVENRTWKTDYRGKLLIHAGSSKKSLFTSAEFAKSLGIETPSELIYSAIIAEVELVDCIVNSRSVWAMEGHYHWILRNPVKYDNPVYCKGQLGLFEYKDAVSSKVQKEDPEQLQLSLF